jgi:hypothetical protein
LPLLPFSSNRSSSGHSRHSARAARSFAVGANLPSSQLLIDCHVRPTATLTNCRLILSSSRLARRRSPENVRCTDNVTSYRIVSMILGASTRREQSTTTSLIHLIPNASEGARRAGRPRRMSMPRPSFRRVERLQDARRRLLAEVGVDELAKLI